MVPQGDIFRETNRSILSNTTGDTPGFSASGTDGILALSVYLLSPSDDDIHIHSVSNSFLCKLSVLYFFSIVSCA